ncbi:MAG: queuosine precursor transporter [Dehalococcoidia bacterium]|nr:queuosine precursor transporter [Dehalococcoidia bacterium]
MKETRPSQYFIVVTAFFITCLIVANIIIVKIITVAGFIFPAAIIIFPLNYIFGDILTEVYGYRRARRVIWLGFFCNLVAVAAFWTAGRLPAASFWDAQGAYDRILGSTPRFLAASFLAYLAGEFSNSFILAKMKIITRGKWLWSRTIGSTIVGQALDTVIVLTIAFWGTMPLATLGVLVVSHWIAKVLYETIATPLTYIVVTYLKKKEGLDTYDHSTRFNPFLLKE